MPLVIILVLLMILVVAIQQFYVSSKFRFKPMKQSIKVLYKYNSNGVVVGYLIRGGFIFKKYCDNNGNWSINEYVFLEKKKVCNILSTMVNWNGLVEVIDPLEFLDDEEN